MLGPLRGRSFYVRGCALSGRVSFFAALLVMAPPALAAPLTFGAIGGDADLTDSPEITSCVPSASEQSGQICSLSRTSFGGVPIESAAAVLNADGRVRSLRIALDARHHDLARNLLTGRYGAPSAMGAAPRWSGFDDGAAIILDRTRRQTLITFDFPQNAAVPGAAVPEGRSLAFLALFGAGAVAAGLMLRRRAKPAPARELSMRETLERRLRDGRDLQV
jgi:hypothetical protein